SARSTTLKSKGNSRAVLRSAVVRSCGIWPRSRHGLIRASIPARPLVPEWGPEPWPEVCRRCPRASCLLPTLCGAGWATRMTSRHSGLQPIGAVLGELGGALDRLGENIRRRNRERIEAAALPGETYEHAAARLQREADQERR